MTVVALTGCPTPTADDKPADTGDNGGDDTQAETAPPPWHPTSGSYDVTQGKTRYDTCQFPSDGGGDTAITSATTMDITVAGDWTAFDVLVPNPDGGNPATYACTLTEYAFHCDVADVEDSETAGQYGVDATILVSVDNDGEWTDETDFGGVYSLAVDCRGDGCDFIAGFIRDGFSFPCGAQYTYTATAAASK
jgi:hypothetical protein